MATTTDVYSFRDYLNAVNEHQKAHLLAGIIIMESPASMRHEELQCFLSIILGAFVAEKDLGKVFGSNASFKLKEHYAVQPDLVFVVNERLPLATTNYFDGPPDLAVEIISKGTRRLDYEQKKPAYERAGTRELWIIDYLLGRADFFCLEDSRFVEAALERSRYFRSPLLPGFRLDTRWLWKDPLPKPRPILRKLLG